jgi:hypothetical protein
MPLQVVQVRNDLLGKLGIVDPTAAPTIALEDCVIALNGAMQMLQTAGEDYFTRQTLSQNISAGTASYMLAQNIQAVLGPIRLAIETAICSRESRAVRPVRKDLRRWILVRRWIRHTAAYFVQNLRSGTIGDINRVFIWLAPMCRRIRNSRDRRRQRRAQLRGRRS